MVPRVLALGLALATAAPLAAQTAAATTAPAPTTATAPDPEQLFKLGQQFTNWFLNAEAESLYAYLSPESQQEVGSVAEVQRRIGEFMARAGGELSVLEEKMNRRNGHPQFWHEALFEQADEPIVIRWLFDDNAKIVGVGLGPKSGTPPPDSE